MPRHMEVRVRVPVNKVGEFIDVILPEWADLAGVDKLVEIEDAPRKTKSKPNGAGRPARADGKAGKLPKPGSVPAALFKRIKKFPGQTRAELFAPLLKNYPESALSSALYAMRNRHLITQDGESKWFVLIGRETQT